MKHFPENFVFKSVPEKWHFSAEKMGEEKFDFFLAFGENARVVEKGGAKNDISVG